MPLIQRLLAITLLAITPLGLMTACGDKEAGTAAPASSDTSAAAATALPDNAPGAEIRSDVQTPWPEMSTLEQSVMSPLYHRWDSIPADEQADLRKEANRWTRMTPEEQAEFKESWKKYL